MKTRRLIQIVLLLAIVVAAVRMVVIISSRTPAEPEAAEKQPERPLAAEHYVTPKKLYLFDVKSARLELAGKEVWVKEGYRYTYYPFNAATGRADFEHEAGQLAPLEKLRVKQIVSHSSPSGKGERQVLAVFEKEGKQFAVPIGTQSGENFQFYANEIFLYQDPRELYSFWPDDVWQAIAEHRVKPGMNELQVAFSIGMGIPEKRSSDQERIVQYPNAGNPLVVTYREGRVAEVQPAAGM